MSCIHSYHDRQPIVALVDCNSFYASCEKVFRPDLRDKPVVVLSNNDGCIIARSKEAKALDLDMVVPFFKVRRLLDKHKVTYFSSNYALYGDMSNRVMYALKRFTPNLEVYSIDEAFLDLTGLIPDVNQEKLEAYGREIQRYVYRATGIAVSVGTGETKGLAKIANGVAKKHEACNGVFCMPAGKERDHILEQVEVGKIWGIGGRLAHRLMRRGITNAREFRDADPKQIRYEPFKMGVVGARLVWELRGKPCNDFTLLHPSKKNIAFTRSFGNAVTKLSDMCESVSEYAARAAEKARRQRSVAGTLMVFLMTYEFNRNEPYYRNSHIVKFPVPTATTSELIHYARHAVTQIFRKGYRYKKSGVILSELQSENEVQMSLFDKRNRQADDRLMRTMDSINGSMGAEMVKYAACGVKPGWSLKADFLSPKCTTRWEELRVV